MKTMFDAASPQPAAAIRNFDIAAGYLGCIGATPHTWSFADWASQPNRYRLPILVPSWWAGRGWNATVDVAYATGKLAEIGAPRGILTALDMETQVQPSYIYAYISGMNAAGYQVAVYGSTSTLFRNLIPVNGGSFYWPADITDQPHLMDAARLQALGLPTSVGNSAIPLESVIIATQYGAVQANGLDYDLDVVSDAANLWTVGEEMTPQDIAAIAKAVYDYGEENVNLNGTVDRNVPLGNLAHGAWFATNDPNGPVRQDVAAVMAALKTLQVAGVPATVVLSDADKQDIAVRVVKLFGKDLSNG